MSTLKAEIQQPCAQAQKKAFWAFYSHFTKKNNQTANNTAKKHTKSMEKANQKPKQTITAYILTKTFHQTKTMFSFKLKTFVF